MHTSTTKIMSFLKEKLCQHTYNSNIKKKTALNDDVIFKACNDSDSKNDGILKNKNVFSSMKIFYYDCFHITSFTVHFFFS